MRRRVQLVAGVVACALVLLAGTDALAAQPVRKATARYVGGQELVSHATSVWLTGQDTAGCEMPVAPGVTCFRVRPSETRLKFNVRDKTLRRVSGWVTFFGDGRQFGEPIAFCHRGAVALPRGTTLVRVSLDASTLRCGRRYGGVATAGTVTAQLS